MTTESDDECMCPCHAGAVLVHPAPCCVTCSLCGMRVRASTRDHRCRTPESRRSHRDYWRRLRANAYSGAPLCMALIVAALAVWSAPFPESLVFLVAIVLGGLIAFIRIRRAQETRDRTE